MTAPMPSSSSGSSSGPSGWSDHDRRDGPDEPDEYGERDERAARDGTAAADQSARPGRSGTDEPDDRRRAPERTPSPTADPERYDPWASGDPTAYPATDRGPEGRGPAVRREIVEGLVVAVALTLLGVAMGALWTWLAPKVPLEAAQDGIYLTDPEGEQSVGADGTFTLLALAAGALTGAVAFWLRRHGGIGVVFGLVAGGLLGSLVAWQLGVAWGPTDDVVAHAREVGQGVVFDGPLELRAKSALLAWPIAAVLIHLLHTALFGPREEEARPGW